MAQVPFAARAQAPAAGAARAQAASESEPANLARAKKLFQQAEVQFGLGNFDKALEFYQQAYAAKSLAAFHFNMAQCHRNMKRYEKAIFHFRQYLARTTSSRFRGQAEDLLKDCHNKLKEQREAARIQQKQKRAVTGRASTTTAPPRANDDRSRRRGLHRAYFWSGVGVTAALVAAGTITGAMALSKSSTYRDASTRPEDRPDLRDTGMTLKTVANVTFGAAAVTAVLSGILVFLSDFGGETVQAAPTVGGATFTLSGRL